MDEINNKNYKILSNVIEPGLIIGLIENVGIIVTTKTDPILLLEAKLEGKNVSSKNQLIQQLNPVIGENFSDYVIWSLLDKPQMNEINIKI